MDQLMFRMMELSYKGYHCNQILAILALDAQGKSNPDLVRALGAVANGCGSENGICSTFIGGAAILGLYAGKGGDDEYEDEVLQYMIKDLLGWFETNFGSRYGGITCGSIVGDRTEVKQRCAVVVAETWTKVTQLLTAAGYDISTGKE